MVSFIWELLLLGHYYNDYLLPVVIIFFQKLAEKREYSVFSMQMPLF